jgi:hypothetical protein
MTMTFTLAPEPEDAARETGRLMFAGPVDVCEGRGRNVRPAARPTGSKSALPAARMWGNPA